MHCAYHTWDLSPCPSPFPCLLDGRTLPLFCLSTGDRYGVAWLDCLDLHSAPYSEEPKIDKHVLATEHLWCYYTRDERLFFPFTHLVAVKQNRENTCSARFILNSRSLRCLCMFFTLALIATNYLTSQASAYTEQQKIFKCKTN